MEKTYGWPRHHREGYPDLVGPEVDIHRMIEPFNAEHQHLQIVLVNQFGWSSSRIGQRVPEGMGMTELRCATDVELGMATYEPFGISPLEPLSSGAVCVISNVCGCAGFVDRASNGKGSPNVLIADYTQLGEPWSIGDLKAMGTTQRDAIEIRVSQQLADDLIKVIPTTDAQRKKLLKSGQTLAKQMSWDRVIEDGMLPMLNRVASDLV